MMLTSDTDSFTGARLRAANGPSFRKLKVQTKFGERASSYLKPLTWNSSPCDLQSITNTYTDLRHVTITIADFLSEVNMQQL